MLNIAVLASTSGTDLQAIIDEIQAGTLPVNLTCVIGNKENCYALERAKNAGYESIFLDPKGKEREAYDQKIDKVLQEKNVDLIILIGYMKLMSEWFVQKYRNKIMNVHPSLLPSFPGMDLDVHKEVLDHGCKISGCSIIFVDENKDTGPIILQKSVEIEEGETVDSLRVKVHELEKKWFPEVIRWYADNKISVNGRIVSILK